MKRILFATILAITGLAAWAGPAPWYLWRSPYADHTVCSQLSPGIGWVAIKGPFQDAVCRKPATS